jgi:hypothetical protein
MMLKRIFFSCSFYMSLLLISGTVANAQSIVIMFDNNCTPSLHIDGLIVPNGGDYHIPADKEKVGALKVFFSNAAISGKVMITIKSISQEPAFEKTGVEALFKSTNPASIKELVKAPAGSTQLDLSQPFELFAGCKENPAAAYSCKFIPILSGQSQPPAGASESNRPAGLVIANNTPTADKAPYRPGSAVYDALKLADQQNLSQDELRRIVQYYYPDSVIDDINKARDALRQNPFLQNVEFKPGKYDLLATAQAGSSLLSSLSLSSIGGLDVTNLVDGLAKFLVKRTKEELSTAFFEKLKDTLAHFPDLQTLFPETNNLLGSIGTEVYNYEKYIQNLREAFKGDIASLYKHLPGIVDNHPAFFARHKAVKAGLLSGCYAVGALQQQVHPGDMLANYPVEYLDSLSRNWSGSIQTLQLLSMSMRDTSGTDKNYWVSIKYMRQLVNTKNAFAIYLGLLYQMAITNYDGIPFEKNSLAGLLKDVAPNFISASTIYNTYKTYVLRFAEKTDALNNIIREYAKPANDSLALELYKKYFDASQDLLAYAAAVGKLPLLNRVPFLSTLSDTLAPLFKLTSLATDLIIDINRKNYPAAVNDALLIYDIVCHKPATEDMAYASNAGKATDNTAMAAVADTVETANIGRTLRNLARFGAFMSTVATAKTSDEVATAIEAFVLPSGSSRVKRQSGFNVALNAYVGPYAGFENLPVLKKNATSFSAGLTAPVGVAFSWGNKGKKGGSSYTLFVPLIDIGTVAAFRFANDSSSLSSTIQLKNIVSPGLYFYYGIRKTPLSVGIGAQMGPQLRNITAQDININKKAYIRYGLTVVVDIPLLNFFTRPD